MVPEPPSEHRFGLRLGRSWLFSLFVGFDREKHVVIKAVSSVISVFAEIEIDFGRLRQPKNRLPGGKRDGTILNRLMLADKADFGHWPDQVCFNTDDMKFVGGDPSPSFDIHRINPVPDLVAVHAIRTIFALFEMYQPASVSVPVRQAFARHHKIVAHVGVKDEGQGNESSAGDLIGVIGEGEYCGAEFVNGDEA